ncbi:MAG: hypothetical protein ACFCUU_05350 [Cyclobacteriaceae bacterium]
MRKKQFLICGILLFNYFASFCLDTDSIKVQVSGVESKELRDYYNFEGIDYFKFKIIGNGIENQFFIVTSHEYSDGKQIKNDTLANTKMHRLKNFKDTLDIRVICKKIDSLTTKIQFHLPRFTITKNFKTLAKDTYKLRDATSNGEQTIAATEAMNLLVYSLPYEDPKYPGYLQYCELSREGIPPEKWGDKFGVKHYIIFKLQLIN